MTRVSVSPPEPSPATDVAEATADLSAAQQIYSVLSAHARVTRPIPSADLLALAEARSRIDVCRDRLDDAIEFEEGSAPFQN